MRHAPSVVMLGLCALGFISGKSATAAPADPGPKAAAAATPGVGANYSRIDGRWWYRTAEGQRYVYSCNQWVRIPKDAGDAASAQAPAPQTHTVRRYSVAPSVIITYPNDGPPDVSHGVDWYRNGRGNFSD